MLNYMMIIAHIQFKYKSYVLHIKTSQVKKLHHLYIYKLYRYTHIFVLF